MSIPLDCGVSGVNPRCRCYQSIGNEKYVRAAYGGKEPSPLTWSITARELIRLSILERLKHVKNKLNMSP